ncbi:MAG TPA: hypothetical protein VGM07_08495 [Stellaceae bacterium]|jgi:hypothetical protein
MSEDAGQSCRRAKKLPVTGWVVILALAVAGLSAGCRASELPGPAKPAKEILASVTILSDAAMANEKGTGLQLPTILNDPTGRQRVLLWDELRAPPQQLAPATDPNVSTTVK